MFSFPMQEGMMLMNKPSVENYVELINAQIAKSVPECTCGESVVHEAMKYSLSAGGKRIRPMLVLEFCRISGGFSAEEKNYSNYNRNYNGKSSIKKFNINNATNTINNICPASLLLWLCINNCGIMIQQKITTNGNILPL